MGTLLPIEDSILATAFDLKKRGAGEFYGFAIAKEIKERQGARILTAYGTLYKALERLQRMGFLVGRWEDPLIAANENRPRRRLYKLTGEGERVAALCQPTKAQLVPKLTWKPVRP